MVRGTNEGFQCFLSRGPRLRGRSGATGSDVVVFVVSVLRGPGRVDTDRDGHLHFPKSITDFLFQFLHSSRRNMGKIRKYMYNRTWVQPTPQRPPSRQSWITLIDHCLDISHASWSSRTVCRTRPPAVSRVFPAGPDPFIKRRSRCPGISLKPLPTDTQGHGPRTMVSRRHLTTLDGHYTQSAGG